MELVYDNVIVILLCCLNLFSLSLEINEEKSPWRHTYCFSNTRRQSPSKKAALEHRENTGMCWCFQCVTILSHSCGKYVLISYFALKGITAHLKQRSLYCSFTFLAHRKLFAWCHQPKSPTVALLKLVKSIQNRLQTLNFAVDDSNCFFFFTSGPNPLLK